MTLLSLKPVFAEPKSLSEEPRYGGTLRLGTYQVPAPFDPFNMTDTISSPLMDLIFNRLIRVNGKGEYEPDLAERWEVSEDGLTYTFYLRRGVKFHDGTECTAKDVLHTFQIISDKEISPSFYNNYKVVKEWKAPSMYTFQVVLKESFSPFLLSLWRAYVTPLHVLNDPKNNLKSFVKHPIGTGPFKFASQDELGGIRLSANEDYFEGRPYLDGIRVRIFSTKGKVWSAFLRNEVDALFFLDRLNYEEIKNHPQFQVYRTLSIGSYAVMFNLNNELLEDERIRQAITYAINRDELIDRLEGGNGVPISGPFHPESWAYNQKVLPSNYEPERAEALLSDAGFIKRDGVLEREEEKLSLNLLVDPRNEHIVRMAKMIRQQLQEIGILINMHFFTDHEQLSKMVYRNDAEYQLGLFVFNTGPEPDVVSLYWEGSVPFNRSNFNNNRVNHLFNAARTRQSLTQRAVAYQEIHQIIATEKPAVFLYVPYVFHATSNKVFNAEGLATPFFQARMLGDVYVVRNSMKKGGDALGD